MDYTKIYYSIIEYRQTTPYNGYTERHHIIPKCMGGTNDIYNLVDLTAREHYVIHQLLIKMYPKNLSLVCAANRMTHTSKDHIGERSKNRLYEWLRIKLSLYMKETQSGKGNSQYGTRWIYNIELKQSKTIKKDESLPDGWKEGRIIKWDKMKLCLACNKSFMPKLYDTKFCSRICSTSGINNPSWRGTYHTPLGIFETCIEAANAHQVNKSTITRRTKNPNFSDYYIK